MTTLEERRADRNGKNTEKKSYRNEAQMKPESRRARRHRSLEGPLTVNFLLKKKIIFEGFRPLYIMLEIHHSGSELQWLPCQAPGVIGSALGLVGPVSVYCDWVRWKV